MQDERRAGNHDECDPREPAQGERFGLDAQDIVQDKQQRQDRSCDDDRDIGEQGAPQLEAIETAGSIARNGLAHEIHGELK